MADDATARGPLGRADPATHLILDFLESLRAGPRSYAEVMEAWRTACPRLTIWEDAVEAGWVRRERKAGGAAVVALTEAGVRRLEERDVSAPHG